MAFFDQQDIAVVSEEMKPPVAKAEKSSFFDQADIVSEQKAAVAGQLPEETDRDNRIAFETQRARDELNDLPPASFGGLTGPVPVTGVTQTPEQVTSAPEPYEAPVEIVPGGDIRQPAFVSPEFKAEEERQPVSPEQAELVAERRAVKTKLSPWLVNAPLEAVTRQLEETNPDAVATRMSRSVMDAEQKFVTEAARAAVTGPLGKVLNLFTQILAPDTEFAQKQQATQEAARKGMFQDVRIPVISDVLDIMALGPPAMWATKVGPFMLPILEAAGQMTDAAAGMEDTFSLKDIATSAVMAGLIKAGGFVPASVREGLLASGGGVAARIAKASVPNVAMAAEMAALGPAMNGALALADGDVEGFKRAWREYPKETVNLAATFLTLGLMPLAKAGMGGAVETKLMRLGLEPADAKIWANNLVYNPKVAADVLWDKLNTRWSGEMTDSAIEGLVQPILDGVRVPAYADVIRDFHTGRPISDQTRRLAESALVMPEVKAGLILPKTPPTALEGIRITRETQVPLAEVKVAELLKPIETGVIPPELADGIEMKQLPSGERLVKIANLKDGTSYTASFGDKYYKGPFADKNLKRAASIGKLQSDGTFSHGVQKADEVMIEANGDIRNLSGKLTIVDPPRYIHGENRDKETLADDVLPNLPEVQRLPRAQQTILAEALKKYNGAIDDITPDELSGIIDATKIVRPLPSAERIDTMNEMALKRYIAGVLFKGEKGETKKIRDKRRHDALKEMGFVTKGEVISMADMSHEMLKILAKKATERYLAHPPVIDKKAGKIANDKLVASLMQAIGDVYGADVKPRPPGLTEAERKTVLSYLSDGNWIKTQDPDGALRKEFVDKIAYPLPRDPDSLRNTLLRFQTELRGRVMGEEQVRTERGRTLIQRIINLGKTASSRRLMVDKISRNTGNYDLFKTDLLRIAMEKTQYTRMSELIEKKVFKDTGVHNNIIPYVSDNTKLEDSFKLIVGVDPRSKNTDLLKARTEALEIVSKDPRGSEIMKTADAYREILNGESAINVRLLKVNEYSRIRNQYKQAYDEINSIPEAERTSRQKKLMSKIERQLKELLPWYADEKTGEPRQVSVEDMDKAWKIRKTGDDKAIRKYLGEQTWGTRDFYYMSTKNMDAETILNPQGAGELPPWESTDVKGTVRPTGRIERRLGIPEFKEGSPFRALDRHIANLAVQAYTLDDARYVVNAVNEAANKGYIDKWLAKELNKAVKASLGQSEETNIFSKIVYGITRTWWTSFGFILPKIGFFTARNFGQQGVPWGAMAGQYKMADISAAQVKYFSELRNPKSEMNIHNNVRFRPNISLQGAKFREGYLQLPHTEKTKIPNKAMSQAQDFVAAEFSFSDDLIRKYTTQTGDIIVGKYVDDFITGKINQAQLERGLKLNVMPESHRNYLLELFNEAIWKERDAAGNPVLQKANFRNFAWETTEMKTLLANYPYQVNERSALEQNPDIRWVWGIPVYARGTFEVVNETIARPLAGVWHRYAESGFDLKHLDFKDAQDAIGNVTAHVLGRALTSYLLGKSIGEREEFTGRLRRGFRKQTLPSFSLEEEIAGYRLLGPGFSTLYKITEAAGKLTQALFAKDKETVIRESEKLSSELYYFTALIPGVKSFMEAIGDRNGMKNADVVKSLLLGKIQGGEWQPRSGYAAIMHMIFDTEPMYREDNDVYKIWKSLTGK